jgi:hypothetical protein
MTDVAVKTKAPLARLGYKNPVLRAASSVGISLAGLAGVVGSLNDVIDASNAHTTFKLMAHNAEHLQYSLITPGWNFGGAVGPMLLTGGGAALVAVGILQGIQALRNAGLVTKSALGMGGALTVLSIITGALSYGATSGSGQGDQAEADWMKAQFNTSHEIPAANKVYNSTQRRYEYYPAVFSGMSSGNKELFYSVAPLLNKQGDAIGLDVKQIPKDEAQKQQLAYTNSLSQSSSSR